MKPLELAALMGALEDLRKAYPEIEEDESLLLGMVEGETNAFEVLAAITHEMMEAAEMKTAIASRAKALAERKSRYDRKEDALRALAQRIMDAAGLRKAELAEATLSIRPGSASVIITDEAELPDQFVKIKRDPLKNEIKAAIKSGEFVPGAMLSNGSETLNVLRS